MRDSIRESYARLWRYCYVLAGTRADADDLAQATALRALEHSDSYAEAGKFDRWLFRIAQRIWYNELRARKVRRGEGVHLVEDLDIPDEKMSTETNILAGELLSKVMALPEAQRITVMMVYVEGYTYKETADVLEIPAGTIMSRLAAARQKIARTMSDSFSDVG